MGKLVEECSENIKENEMIYNNTLNDYKLLCGSCTIYIVFLDLYCIIRIKISSVFFIFIVS